MIWQCSVPKIKETNNDEEPGPGGRRTKAWICWSFLVFIYCIFTTIPLGQQVNLTAKMTCEELHPLVTRVEN